MPLKPEVIGIVAGVLTSTSLIPQIVKTIREKKAREISTGIFIMLIAGNGLWGYYGILREDLPLILTSAVSVTLNLLMLALKIKFGTR